LKVEGKALLDIIPERKVAGKRKEESTIVDDHNEKEKTHEDV